MTDVTLKEFKFALPTVVSIDNENNECYISSTEFPHDFFGLSAVDQVAVTNGTLCAVVKHIRENTGQIHESGHDSVVFPMNIGIGVTVRRSPKLSIEVQFSFPAYWENIPRYEKEKVLDSIGYLLQTAAISIVNRESKLEDAHE